jgi:hypothetical protein
MLCNKWLRDKTAKMPHLQIFVSVDVEILMLTQIRFLKCNNTYSITEHL